MRRRKSKPLQSTVAYKHPLLCVDWERVQCSLQIMYAAPSTVFPSPSIPRRSLQRQGSTKPMTTFLAQIPDFRELMLIVAVGL